MDGTFVFTSRFLWSGGFFSHAVYGCDPPLFCEGGKWQILRTGKLSYRVTQPCIFACGKKHRAVSSGMSATVAGDFLSPCIYAACMADSTPSKAASAQSRISGADGNSGRITGAALEIDV